MTKSTTTQKCALGILVGLIVLFICSIVINNMMEESDLRDAQARARVAEAEQRQKDELMRLDEEHAGTVGGPMARHEKELEDMPKKSNDMSAAVQGSIRVLDAQSHWYDTLADSIQNAWERSKTFWVLGILVGLIVLFIGSIGSATGVRP